MIYDLLGRASAYRPLSPRIARAIDFATGHANLASLPPGRVEVDGDDIFAVVHAYQPKSVDDAKWEAHRKYIDLQIVLSGAERMDVTDVDGLAEVAPFDAAKDVLFYESPPTYQSLVVPAGSFTIFFPHDAHRPTIAVEPHGPVTKIVFKIAVG